MMSLPTAAEVIWGILSYFYPPLRHKPQGHIYGECISWGLHTVGTGVGCFGFFYFTHQDSSVGWGYNGSQVPRGWHYQTCSLRITKPGVKDKSCFLLFFFFIFFTMCLSSFVPARLLLSWQFFLTVLCLTPEPHLPPHPVKSNNSMRWHKIGWFQYAPWLQCLFTSHTEGTYLPSWLEVFLSTSTLPRSPDDMVLWIFFWSLWDALREEDSEAKSIKMA